MRASLNKYLLIIIIFLFFQAVTVFSQNNNNNRLKSMFKNADTIMLVSHTSTIGNIVDDITNKPLPREDLIIHGKLNDKIILEKRIINDKSLDTLINILKRPFADNKVAYAMCFDPHQAILIIKNGKTSFFEICFGCHRFTTSKDLSFIYDFDKRKWIELLQFFIGKGFKYELLKN